MADQSHLDNKYFIDEAIYNCPFCNRRHVTYALQSKYTFNWSDNKKCYAYLAECFSCNNVSMHLSFANLSVYQAISGRQNYWRFYQSAIESVGELDDAFFFSVPTSYFTLDTRIPRVLREPVTEAEGCLKSNFLTGASACARKVVYELSKLQKATGNNYEDRVKSLKAINPTVDAAYFDTLLTIQQVTSTKVHEEAYDGWEAKHLRLILSALTEALHEIYVAPAIRQEKRKAIIDLKNEILSPKAKVQVQGN